MESQGDDEVAAAFPALPNNTLSVLGRLGILVIGEAALFVVLVNMSMGVLGEGEEGEAEVSVIVGEPGAADESSLPAEDGEDGAATLAVKRPSGTPAKASSVTIPLCSSPCFCCCCCCCSRLLLRILVRLGRADGRRLTPEVARGRDPLLLLETLLPLLLLLPPPLPVPEEAEMELLWWWFMEISRPAMVC